MGYETSAAETWLNNDPDLHHDVERMADNALSTACDNESHSTTARNDAVEQLAGEIQALLSAMAPNMSGLWGGLISSAMQAIDFEEIARTWLADKPIFSVFSSDAEDAELFTDFDEAKGSLEEKLDDDNTMHAGALLALEKLQPGGQVDINGTTYVVTQS